MSSGNTSIDLIIDIARGAVEGQSVDAENRNTYRSVYDSPVGFVQWTPNGGKSIPTVVQCKNISSTGVCVASRYMLHVGHEGALLMRRSNDDEVMVGVKVVHSRYVGDMQHESGLMFTDVAEGISLEDFRDEQGHMPQLKQAA